MTLSKQLSSNIKQAKEIFPIGTSFDLLTRELILGNTKAYWIGINGFCQTSLLQHIFSDLQNPIFFPSPQITDISHFLDSKIGYSQAELLYDWDSIISSVLSGASVLFLDGFDVVILLDARTYPTRSVAEPDTEKVTKGSRDGFVETLVFNCNLIRRRLRTPKLTFEVSQIGTCGKTDVALAYIEGEVNEHLLQNVKKKLKELKITTLTMGSKSLEELLLKKRWYHLLPSIQTTERPDVACSYLAEGHLLLIVDNSPSVLLLPGTIFQFTQSPEDYYKAPVVGNYLRFVRFFCIILSLFLLPLFFLLTAYYPQVSENWHLLPTENLGPVELFVYILAVEFLLDLFKYSSSNSSSRFSGSLALIGGLIIGDVAVELDWASMEILFYAAVTLLTTLSLSSIEFGDAIRLYRIFLIFITGFFGAIGFYIGLACVFLSIITTPTFSHMSYFWPLFPFNGKALKTLLFRYPTFKAQPTHIWKRK